MNRRQLLQSLTVAPVAASLTPLTHQAERTGFSPFVSSASGAAAQAGTGAADRVIVISLDGVRTQEMFGGIDVGILQHVIGEKVKAADHALYKTYWRETREARREALMPFIWGTWLKSHASIVGDREAGSVMTLGNTQRFSYPGYAELMTGVPHDDVITSNDNKRYPFETVLQVLRRELRATREQVACFGSWDVFTSISSSVDDAVFVNAGFQAYDSPDPRMQALSAAQFETVPGWNSARYDHYTWQFALDHLKRHQPRVLWIGLDESDDWSHGRNYVRLIEYLHRFDGWLAKLWEQLQTDPTFKGRTALMLVTDHGRGNTTADWNSHGKDTEGAQYVWAAVSAPNWPARGVWAPGHPPASQSQVAATIAALIGKSGPQGAGAGLSPVSKGKG